MTTSNVETERGRFRLTPNDRLAIEQILEVLHLSQRADVVRIAVGASHYLFRQSQDASVVLRHEGLREQEEVYLGPGGVPTSDETKGEGEKATLEVRLSSTDADRIESLVEAKFGANRTQVVRRSIHLTRRLLSRLREGWMLGRLSPKGEFLCDHVPGLEVSDISSSVVSRASASPPEATQRASSISVSTEDDDSSLVASPFSTSVISDPREFIEQQQFLIGRANGHYDIWVLNPARLPIVSRDDFLSSWCFNILKGVVYRTIWVIDDTSPNDIHTFLQQACCVSRRAHSMSQQALRRGGIVVVPLLLKKDGIGWGAYQETWNVFAALSEESRDKPDRCYVKCETPLYLGEDAQHTPLRLQPVCSDEHPAVKQSRLAIRDSVSQLLAPQLATNDALIAYLPSTDRLHQLPVVAVVEKEVHSPDPSQRQFAFLVEPADRTAMLKRQFGEFNAKYSSYWKTRRQLQHDSPASVSDSSVEHTNCKPNSVTA